MNINTNYKIELPSTKSFLNLNKDVLDIIELFHSFPQTSESLRDLKEIIKELNTAGKKNIEKISRVKESLFGLNQKIQFIQDHNETHSNLMKSLDRIYSSMAEIFINNFDLLSLKAWMDIFKERAAVYFVKMEFNENYLLRKIINNSKNSFNFLGIINILIGYFPKETLKSYLKETDLSSFKMDQLNEALRQINLDDTVESKYLLREIVYFFRILPMLNCTEFEGHFKNFLKIIKEKFLDSIEAQDPYSITMLLSLLKSSPAYFPKEVESALTEIGKLIYPKILNESAIIWNNLFSKEAVSVLAQIDHIAQFENTSEKNLNNLVELFDKIFLCLQNIKPTEIELKIFLSILKNQLSKIIDTCNENLKQELLNLNDTKTLQLKNRLLITSKRISKILDIQLTVDLKMNVKNDTLSAILLRIFEAAGLHDRLDFIQKWLDSNSDLDLEGFKNWLNLKLNTKGSIKRFAGKIDSIYSQYQQEQ